MPTYEYTCTDCGQHVEVVQQIREGPLTTCGICGGALRKVFHPAGILFKGSGFYATDNRKGSTQGDAKPDTKLDTKSEKKPDTKSDTTSDTKPQPGTSGAGSPKEESA